MRKTPLKPGTGFLRSKTRAARPVGVLGQASHQAIRSRKCAVESCRAPFVPARPFIKWCSPECGVAVALALKAKAERRADKVQRESLKSRSDHMKDAQIAFNAFVRERDKDLPCICCGRTATNVQGLGSHGWDCGHYRSVGSAPHMRFIENNAHRQLVLCNRYGAGRAVDYRIGLIARIGLAAVEALEADNEPRKYTADDLKAIRATYKAKLKELTK